MTALTLASTPIIDSDSHAVEPVDLWTSRMPKKWLDQAPRVEWDERAGESRWRVGDVYLSGVGEYCSAGWREPFPSHPPTLDEADPACWKATERAAKLDSWGVHSQVLYPNVIAFDTHVFMTHLDPEVALACVQAYNDFLTDFSAEAPNRFIPIMMLPVWDVDASVQEMKRCRERGHKGVLFAALLDRIGLPHISDERYVPILNTAQDLEMSLNFHLGVGVRTADDLVAGWNMRTKTALAQRTNRLSFVKKTSLSFVSSIEAMADVILRGICEQYPRLKFVSVESGFGYWPYILEHMDWLWASSGSREEFSGRLLPSEYWRRQFYCTFWHERETLKLLPDFADNVMFETDYPHETCLAAQGYTAREAAKRSLENVSQEVAEKVLFRNAAKLYGIDVAQ